MKDLSNQEVLEKRHSKEESESIQAHVECITRATKNPDHENYFMNKFLGYNTIL